MFIIQSTILNSVPKSITRIANARSDVAVIDVLVCELHDRVDAYPLESSD